jgi:WD40 repeat protein
MSDPRRERVEELFHEAADLPPGERATFLDAACGDDAGLRAEVEKLLRHDDADDDASLGSPAVGLRAALGAAPLPDRVGGFRVVRKIGDGGMGTVYEAEQENPRRRVAVKVIRAGLATPALVRRFTREADVLGRMQHPGIARIYEAGVAADGLPYIAMELVRGLPLDEYTTRHSPDPAAKLGLVARVCEAVQYAHEQGVVHRDLKPANVLVDATGQPKVVDFGIARISGGEHVSTAGRTATGQLIGTLAYMSPEQLGADPAAVDARSDVYALGVILFELLAGRLPFDLTSLPLPEAARRIREDDPTRLGTMNTLFRGPVETIVAKALEKDRDRRYPTAAALAADLHRHLRDERIEARSASALYHLRKFARRHKALVGGVAAVLLALVLGLISSVLFAVRAEWHRQLADKNAATATDKGRVALHEAYRARIAAATAALQMSDVVEAERQLRSAPDGLRDWEWYHLSSRLDQSSAAVRPPAGTSVAALPTPTGVRILWNDGTTARITDPDGREERRHPLKEGGFAGFIASPLGVLGLFAADGRFRLRDRDGRDRFDLTVPAGVTAPWSIAVSPDGVRVAVVWRPGEREFVVIDRTNTVAPVRCGGHTDRVNGLFFSPDGTTLASTSDDGTAILWDARTGERRAVLRGHGVKVFDAAFRPDGARLLTNGADGTVRQWDARTGEPVEPPYDRHAGEVLAAAYSPDGEWIASAGQDRVIHLWRASGRRETRTLHGHTAAVYSLAFEPDGRKVVSTARDGTVFFWDATPGNLLTLAGHASYVYPVAYSPDGEWLASGGWDDTARLWDARTGECCAVLRHPSRVLCLAFAADGRLATGCGEDGVIRLWDVNTGKQAAGLDHPGRKVRLIAARPDRPHLAVGFDTGAITILDAATGDTVHTLPNTDVLGLDYSPDGRFLAACDGLGHVRLYDTDAYREAVALPRQETGVRSVRFSRESDRLVTVGHDRTVRVWDVKSGTRLATMTGHTEEVFTAVFHPGGTRVASAGRDRTILIWDATTGEEVARLQGHTNYVWSLAFSPDGHTLASGAGDTTVRLWDTDPPAERHRERREAETLRPQAERLVAELFRRTPDAGEVADSVRRDVSLGEGLRRAALRAVLREVAK